MRPVDIDLRNGWWTIPGEFAKNGFSHRVPLTSKAVEIIRSLPSPGNDQDWSFPSPTRKGQYIASVQKAAQRVQMESGVEDFVLHDLRRTAASNLASLGVSNYVIGRILNHVETGVTAVYNRHSYDGEKRKALELWEKKLLEIID